LCSLPLVPILETPRLLIRPFEMQDLEDAHQLLDIELREAEMGSDKFDTLAERAEWLQWAILNYDQLAKLHQPPYGDRAIVLKVDGQLIGACGFVPCLNRYEQISGFGSTEKSSAESLGTTEFGLFYAISPRCQRQGYATEAAQALIDYAFGYLRLRRVIAETDYDNLASIGVMHKLGMRIEKNPYPEPPWLQVVGVLENK
jgi:ribosomal-protein-alanine N-acetyltransferase